MIPTNEDYWRALILYGKTQSTYKMALGKCLIKFASDNKEKVDMDELGSEFFKLYINRCKSGKPQLAHVGRTTFVEQEIQAINIQGKSEAKALEVIKKDCLNNMVLKKFNNLYNTTLKQPFYSMQSDKQLILNNNLLNLFADKNKHNLSSELDSRWDLLEYAFENIKKIEILDVDEHVKHLINKEKRTNITRVSSSIEGYQQGRCFYCGEKLYDIAVDYVIPYQAILHNQIWNLVLAHKFCNEDKSDNMPPIHFVENLIKRNEYFILSDHPIKNTIIKQLGNTKEERITNTMKEYKYAKNKIVRVWGGNNKYNPEKDEFYGTWVRHLGTHI